MVGGRVSWSNVQSKLVTYHEWNDVARLASGAATDATNTDALVWVVAYDGPMTGSFDCQWTLVAVAADGRISDQWQADECGNGNWPSRFDLLVDRSWPRLEVLRGGS